MANFLVLCGIAAPFVQVYDTDTWTLLPLSEAPPGVCRHAAISPDGSTVALYCVPTGQVGRVVLYDARTWERLPDLAPISPQNSTSRPLSFSADSSMLVVGNPTRPYAAVYDTNSWGVVSGPTLRDSPFLLAFAPHESTLAAGRGYETGWVSAYDTTSWTKVGEVSLRWVDVVGGAYSPDGSLLAVASNTPPYLVVCNTSDWSRLPPPAVLPPREVRSVAFSPDGSLLAVAHALAPRVTVYRTNDWSAVGPIPGLTANTLDVAFSPDGSLLALGTYAGLLMYDTSSWAAAPIPSGIPFSEVRRVAFSPPAPPVPNPFWTNFVRARESLS